MTTNYEGAIKELEAEAKRYNLELLAVQETKQKDGFETVLENYIFLNSGNDKRIFSMGFLVSKRIKGKIRSFIPVNDRLCHIALEAGDKILNIINCHASTEEKEEEIKDEFYESLENVYERIDHNQAKIIIGDIMFLLLKT